jgi:phosphoribosylformylglycinamidine synthase
LIDSAHDLSDGGLAQALVESCLRGGIGARVWLPDELDPFVALFSESAGRAIVAVPRSEEVRFTDMCTARRFVHLRVGVTDGVGAEAALEVQGQFSVTLAELRTAWSATLPAAFGS